MWEWFVTNGIWILIAVVAGLVLFFLLRRWAKRGIEKTVPEQWREQLKGTERVVTWITISIIGMIIALAVAAVTISRLGLDISSALEAVGSWLLEHGILILIIIALSYLAYRVSKILVPRLIERTIHITGKGRRAREEGAKRAHTLGGFITAAIGMFIVIIAIFMILSEVGIDITPLLAGAGVAGIAIGFGAQYLIRDVLAGIFIILEAQYSKGDWIEIAGANGLVEEVNLRRTVLRDLDGNVHTIPNGEIKLATNFSKEWARVNMIIPVAYGEDLDHVIEIINRVGKELAQDDTFGPMIRKAPQFLRVNDFGSSSIDMKVLGETKPMMQWAVMGELRKRIKKIFDEEGIEIPWPHVKLYFGQDQISQNLTCKACARPNPPDSKFCTNCGAPLGS